MVILSTRCMDSRDNECDDNIDSEHELNMSPKEQTIDLLRQFARSYHAERSLCDELRGYLLN